MTDDLDHGKVMGAAKKKILSQLPSRKRNGTLSKQAKDVGSAAVFVSLLGVAAIWTLILI